MTKTADTMTRSHTPTPQTGVKAAYRAGYADGRKSVDALVAALREAVEFVEDHVDVVDGDYGIPAPNRAMSLLPTLQAALAAADKE